MHLVASLKATWTPRSPTKLQQLLPPMQCNLYYKPTRIQNTHHFQLRIVRKCRNNFELRGMALLSSALSSCAPAAAHRRSTAIAGHDSRVRAVGAVPSHSKFVGVQGRIHHVSKSTMRAALTADAPSAKPDTDFLSYKTELLSIVAGLDRGLLASANDETLADMAARKLEGAADSVEFPGDLDLLQGRWRLVYSSGFVTGSLGGQRPGPPVGRLLPLTLGQVYQRIDIVRNELDNIVDLRIGTPWPLPPIEITATLSHTLELIGGNGIRIVFEKTTVTPSGNLSQLPPFDTPSLPDFLRQSSNTRSGGNFDTTYLDKDFRISRGDRGELRIFVRA